MVQQDARQPLLKVINLKTYFYTEEGVLKAVDGVDLNVYPGEVMGLVGESGCGKSVTSFSIMRLVSQPGKIVDGQILFKGKDLLTATEDDMIQVRGNSISMIFQQPQMALNPVFRVGDQIGEALRIHQNIARPDGQVKAIKLLKMVGIPDPEQRIRAYPHELSGGQAQRVMIAIALACEPNLLIADEPTTALDVTIQAQILDLLRNLRESLDTAIILITHDLGVVAEMCERVAVMYAGHIVEQADVTTLFQNPLHPYTQGLIGSIPVLGQVRDRLEVIDGSVPNLVNLPPGCRFASRCQARSEYGLKICDQQEPNLITVSAGHSVRCWLYQDAENHSAPLRQQSFGDLNESK